MENVMKICIMLEVKDMFMENFMNIYIWWWCWWWWCSLRTSRRCTWCCSWRWCSWWTSWRCSWCYKMKVMFKENFMKMYMIYRWRWCSWRTSWRCTWCYRWRWCSWRTSWICPWCYRWRWCVVPQSLWLQRWSTTISSGQRQVKIHQKVN